MAHSSRDQGADDVKGADSGYVCYGMFLDINCQLLQSETTDNMFLTNIGYDADYIALRVTFAEPRILISIADKPPFAQLNTVAASVLITIAARSRIMLEPYMCIASMKALIDSRSRTRGAALSCFKLNVNCFGLRVESEVTGEILSDSGMFLQEPLWRTDKLEYYNPHIWTFEEFPEVDVWLAGLSRNKPLEEQMTPQQDWNQVLDELSSFKSGHTDLDLYPLTADLLKHQKDALGFMSDREIGRLSDAMSYWRSGTDENGTLVYRHSLIAAERRERPNEPASGILADDMGLGKTLSAIALITTSKERAASFALEKGTEQASHGLLTATKTTLVVLPSLLILEEWRKEIEKHTVAGALRVTKYHGHERVATAAELLSYDIVLTTYGTVTTEHRRSYRGGREVLYFLRWFRIILDEAHTIRSARTAQCKAILALYARHHWCLTGTPVSNKVEDLAPLLRFCRVPLLQDPAVFRDHVTKITHKSFRQGCNVLRQVLAPVCLRRTKALLDLPQPRAVDHLIAFSSEEYDRHAALFRHSRRCLDASFSGAHDAKSKHTLLQAILQLRIFCNQGTFMPDALGIEGEALLDPDEALTLLQEDDQAACASCSTTVTIINQGSDLSSGILGECSHILCAVCRSAALEAGEGDNYNCPKCELVFAEKNLSDNRVSYNTSTTRKPRSSKLEKLVQDLLSSQGKEKSIVFSVWKKTLDVASQLCDDAGIRHVRIDGTVPQALRNASLAEFTTRPEISTLLMTLGTGALGLNLTAATRVHIVEPQWNPAVEKQAIGRVVRMGQEKYATIIRYTVKDSVERQIQTYKRRKMQLAAGGFSDGIHHHDYDAKILTATFFTQGKL